METHSIVFGSVCSAAVYWRNVLKGVTDNILYLFYFIIKHGMMMNKWKRDKKVNRWMTHFDHQPRTWPHEKVKGNCTSGHVWVYAVCAAHTSTFQMIFVNIFTFFFLKQTLYSTYILADWLNVVIRRSKSWFNKKKPVLAVHIQL